MDSVDKELMRLKGMVQENEATNNKPKTPKALQPTSQEKRIEQELQAPSQSVTRAL